MYLRNAWYVVAWSNDLAADPLPVMLMGEQVVLFRTADGVAALEDRCPHRHLPLSMGRVTGSNLQCGYHGAQINAEGRCVAVPSQAAVPPRARIRSYAAVERWSWIWVWAGEAEAADPTLIPDFSLLTDPRYSAVGRTNEVACAYRSLLDNLLDLSHVGFVHTSTIGNRQMGEKGELKQETTDAGVRVSRWVIDVPQPPTTRKLGLFPEDANIDRAQVIEYIAPSSIVIHVGNSLTGSGVREGHLPHAINFYILNAITPRDETSSYYFWAAVRDYAVGDDAIDELVFAQIAEAFDEDKTVLERQQEVLARRGDDWSVTFQADVGVVQARRKLARLIEMEQAAQA